METECVAASASRKPTGLSVVQLAWHWVEAGCRIGMAEMPGTLSITEEPPFKRVGKSLGLNVIPKFRAIVAQAH